MKQNDNKKINQLEIHNLASHSNQYVALTQDKKRLLAFGKTIKDVHDQLVNQKIKDAVITYVPPIDSYLSPLCQ